MGGNEGGGICIYRNVWACARLQRRRSQAEPARAGAENEYREVRRSTIHFERMDTSSLPIAFLGQGNMHKVPGSKYKTHHKKVTPLYSAVVRGCGYCRRRTRTTDAPTGNPPIASVELPYPAISVRGGGVRPLCAPVGLRRRWRVEKYR